MSSSDEELWSPQAVLEALGDNTLLSGELDEFLAALRRRYRSVLRLRSELSRTDSDRHLPYQAKQVPWYSLGFQTTDANARPSRHLLYAAGDYYLQDAGSLLALAACGADTQSLSGLTICDLCAAPGGKASGLLEALGKSGFLLANEPIRTRIAPLTYNLSRTGSDRFAVSCMDPEKLADSVPGQFDLVLVDAPCSGQALIGRDKRSTDALSLKQIQHSAARQERILNAAVKLLRPGGRLVYSTCTFAHAENESQTDRLVTDGVAKPLPVTSLAEYATGESTYRLWPHRHNCAGSFAAALEVTKEEDDELAIEPSYRLKRKNRKRESDQKKDQARLLQAIPLGDWYQSSISLKRMKLTDAVLYGWPDDAPQWVTEVAVDGPEIAHRTGQTWKPAHAGALRRTSLCGTGFVGAEAVDVDADTAASFFAGETIQCKTKGWQVVRYRDRPIGWTKASGGAGKNHLPSTARFEGSLEF
jgi:16S rRNA C967 or C1407 C5-methylase (RsmB/RsmF family)/NOL1/NOP2/fmu family ribosome biogenesis protein